jgi:hypothetical protein
VKMEMGNRVDGMVSCRRFGVREGNGYGRKKEAHDSGLKKGK